MNRIHIETQRVQTWLFAVPRLRAMVGANVLLGGCYETFQRNPTMIIFGDAEL